ncbi:MAG: hypothetical protein OXD50_11600 [Chloroflexi bacterium]|nr:hypothetical protein [Chloroflexota bacterium]
MHRIWFGLAAVLVVVMIVVAVTEGLGRDTDVSFETILERGEACVDYGGRELTVKVGETFEVWCDNPPYQRRSGMYEGIRPSDFGDGDYLIGRIVD